MDPMVGSFFTVPFRPMDPTRFFSIQKRGPRTPMYDGLGAHLVLRLFFQLSIHSILFRVVLRCYC